MDAESPAGKASRRRQEDGSVAGWWGRTLHLSHLLRSRDSQMGPGIPRGLYAVNTTEAAATAGVWGVCSAFLRSRDWP